MASITEIASQQAKITATRFGTYVLVRKADEFVAEDREIARLEVDVMDSQMLPRSLFAKIVIGEEE